MEIALIAFGVGSLLFLEYFFSHIFKRFNIPDVLLLMIIGIILGPVLGIIDIESFGIFGEVFVTLTLLIILFDAGLGMKLSGLAKTAPHALGVMLLTLTGTVLVVGSIGYWVLGLSLIECLFIGVLLGGVSSGVALPLVKQLHVTERTKSLIAFETNVSDVLIIGIIFAIIDFTNSGFFNFGIFSQQFGMNMLMALVIGIVVAIAWSQIILRVRGIQNNIFMTPALLLMVFGLTELLGGSGIFAAFVFSISLGNLQLVRIPAFPLLLGFKDFSLTKWEKRMFSAFVFLLKTYFFVYIGLSINFTNTWIIILGLLTTLILLMLRIGTIKIFSLEGISRFDSLVLERIIPKGLVGAALINLINNETAQNFTFSIILWSIVITSIGIILLPKEKFDHHEELNDEAKGEAQG